MDLGIAGRWAVVCASSQGLGRACAAALAGEGVNVVINGRDAERLAAAASELKAARASGARAGEGSAGEGSAGEGSAVEVRAVAADITTAAGRAELLAACPEPDILVTNNAGPRPGRLLDIGDDDLARALELHFWAPIGLVRSVVGGMRARGFGRIVNITSAMVTAPGPGMAGSAAARTGMTAVMKGLAKEVAPDNVTINQLLPERIDSGRQVQMARIEAERAGITYEEARRRQAESIAAKRHGRPEELGAACAFLCSVQASFISGQNLHLDGGSYRGLV